MTFSIFTIVWHTKSTFSNGDYFFGLRVTLYQILQLLIVMIRTLLIVVEFIATSGMTSDSCVKMCYRKYVLGKVL